MTAIAGLKQGDKLTRLDDGVAAKVYILSHKTGYAHITYSDRNAIDSFRLDQVGDYFKREVPTVTAPTVKVWLVLSIEDDSSYNYHSASDVQSVHATEESAEREAAKLRAEHDAEGDGDYLFHVSGYEVHP